MQRLSRRSGREGLLHVRADRRGGRGGNRSCHIGHLFPRPRHHRRRRRQPDERLIGPMSIVFIVFLPLLAAVIAGLGNRSEEHTSELPSLMRSSYAVFCLTNTKNTKEFHTK